jgi:hypothetical protein
VAEESQNLLIGSSPPHPLILGYFSLFQAFSQYTEPPVPVRWAEQIHLLYVMGVIRALLLTTAEIVENDNE